MKTSELRIGNWIKDGNDFEQVTIDHLNCLNSGRCEFDKVPLTEEWLLKFGFELEYSRLTNVYKYFLVNTPFGYSQGQFNIFTQTGCFSVEIKYVHQLQNLYFALTGEELEVKQ